MGGSSSGGGKQPVWDSSAREAEEDWEKGARARQRAKFFRIWTMMFAAASALFIGASFIDLRLHPLHLIGEGIRALLFFVGVMIALAGLRMSEFHWRFPSMLVAMYVTAVVVAGLLFGTLPWLLFG